MSHKHYEEEPIVPPQEDNRSAAYTVRLQQAQEALAKAIAATQDKEAEKESRRTALQQAIDENRFEEEWDDDARWSYVPPEDEPAQPCANAFATLQRTAQNYNDMPTALRQYCASRPLFAQPDAARHLYHDALALADVEDSSEIVPYDSLRPSLQNMTITQLRSYITFRTRWRKGVHLDVSTGYIYLLVYETLMLVGLKDAEEGLQQLQEIYQTYALQMGKGRLKKNMEQWTKDFVVYYNLRNHADEVFASEHESDALIEQLLLTKENTGYSLWPLLPQLCNYSMARCEKTVGDSKLVQQAVDNVFHAIDSCYRQNGLDPICNYAVYPLCESYPMFANALFYAPNMPRNYSFEVNASRRYICDEGRWMLEYYRFDNYFSSILSDILHETDRLLRLLTQSKRTIKAKPIEPELSEIIRQSIADTLQQLTTSRAQAARKAAMDAIHIDMSKLQSIRHDAESVCQQLTVEEEIPETSVADTTSPAPVAETMAENSRPMGTPLLEEAEQTYLQLLLSGSNTAPFLQKKHLPASVLVEAINEKLYETFGDNVLDDSDGTPQVVEDYRDELTSLLP